MGYTSCAEHMPDYGDDKVTPCAAGVCSKVDGNSSTATLANNWEYQEILEHENKTTCSSCRVGCKHGEHKFQKPWTQTLVMFTGEAMCLWYFFFKRSRALASLRSDGLKESLVEGDDKKEAERYEKITWKSALICILPACCDLGGTTLSGIGLLFTSASVFQMLRGSIIFFTAALSVIFLKRKLKAYQYIGACITVVGITLVGTSSMIGAKSKSDDSKAHSLVLLGNILVVLSQLMSAVQMVVEEKFLKKHNLPPEFVVGCEGTFVALMMLCIVLP